MCRYRVIWVSSVIEKQSDVTGCLADTYDGAHRSQFYELGQVGYNADALRWAHS